MAKKPTFTKPKQSPFAPKKAAGPPKPARPARPARPTPFAPPAAGARPNRFAPTAPQAGVGDEGFPLAPPPKGKKKGF